MDYGDALSEAQSEYESMMASLCPVCGQHDIFEQLCEAGVTGEEGQQVVTVNCGNCGSLVMAPIEIEDGEVVGLYDDLKYMPLCTILIGISGSGKSTYAQELAAQNTDTIVVSTDAIRKEVTGNINDQTQNAVIHNIADTNAAAYLSQGKDVIIDATNVNWHQLRERIARIRKYATTSIEIQIHILDVPVHVAAERIAADIAAGVDRANVPLDVLERQSDQFNTLFGFGSIDWLDYVERMVLVEAEGEEE